MFSPNTAKAVTDALVSFVGGDVLVGILDLEEELNSLDGGDDGLGDGGRDTSDEEVACE